MSSAGVLTRLYGKPVRGSTFGAASNAAQPLSCCDMTCSISSRGSTGWKFALPNARANAPASAVCSSIVMARRGEAAGAVWMIMGLARARLRRAVADLQRRERVDLRGPDHVVD